MLQKLAIFSIKTYQYTLSNLCWGSCRFYPTCSKYAIQAIERFGVWSGIWLCCKRLSRCHPWCCGGYDPVPLSTDSRQGLISNKLKKYDG